MPAPAAAACPKPLGCPKPPAATPPCACPNPPPAGEALAPCPNPPPVVPATPCPKPPPAGLPKPPLAGMPNPPAAAPAAPCPKPLDCPKPPPVCPKPALRWPKPPPVCPKPPAACAWPVPEPKPPPPPRNPPCCCCSPAGRPNLSGTTPCGAGAAVGMPPRALETAMSSCLRACDARCHSAAYAWSGVPARAASIAAKRSSSKLQSPPTALCPLRSGA
mmetsp:Transcript_1233/g.4909  ORF Transcript_1233/g.4909 Transcript_1233/m.4909 type:complete len:218 (-) Transcript_1233:156-809(-)